MIMSFLPTKHPFLMFIIMILCFPLEEVPISHFPTVLYEKLIIPQGSHVTQVRPIRASHAHGHGD